MSVPEFFRFLEFITRPVQRIGPHDYDLPVQDVELSDYEAGYQAGAANEAFRPSPVTTRTSAGDRSAAAGILPPTVAAEPLAWLGWSVPAILDVLATHQPRERRSTGDVHCLHGDSELVCHDYGDWSEHVADLIAERIACDSARAVAALQNFQPK